MIKQYSKIEILETIAEAWNEAGINYAVAHGLEKYPDTCGRDLDILVESGHVAEAIRIAGQLLCERGLAVAQPPPLWGARLVAFHAGTWDDAIEVHTMPRLSWRNVTFASRSKASAWIGPFKVDPWVSFAKRVMTPLLAGETLRFTRKPEELSILESERDLVMSRLQFFCGLNLAQDVCAAIDRKDVAGLGSLIPHLRRYLACGLSCTPLWHLSWWVCDQFGERSLNSLLLVPPL
jgi:hypothetical protein